MFQYDAVVEALRGLGYYKGKRGTAKSVADLSRRTGLPRSYFDRLKTDRSDDAPSKRVQVIYWYFFDEPAFENWRARGGRFVEVED